MIQRLPSGDKHHNHPMYEGQGLWAVGFISLMVITLATLFWCSDLQDRIDVLESNIAVDEIANG